MSNLEAFLEVPCRTAEPWAIVASASRTDPPWVERGGGCVVTPGLPRPHDPGMDRHWFLVASLAATVQRQHERSAAGGWVDHPDFTQELPRKLLPTSAKEGQSHLREK